MKDLSRRGFIAGGVAAGGAAALTAAGTGTAAADTTAAGCFPAPPAKDIRPGDPRYAELTARGYNGRFSGRPESVRLVHRADQVVAAVDDALRTGRRIAVRSGGHCFEGFVDDPAVQVVVDVSEMKSVHYDPRHKAFAIESGATLGEVYRTLYLGWGVTVPAGACPGVGAGGHIAGGGYGGCRATTASSPTTCTASRSSWPTAPAGPAWSPPPVTPPTPTTTCGGPTPAAEAATSASSPAI